MGLGSSTGVMQQVWWRVIFLHKLKTLILRVLNSEASRLHTPLKHFLRSTPAFLKTLGVRCSKRKAWRLAAQMTRPEQ